MEYTTFITRTCQLLDIDSGEKLDNSNTDDSLAESPKELLHSVILLLVCTCTVHFFAS